MSCDQRFTFLSGLQQIEEIHLRERHTRGKRGCGETEYRFSVVRLQAPFDSAEASYAAQMNDVSIRIVAPSLEKMKGKKKTGP
jgi:hypothetical protein